MKNLHQNLLIILALALCGLCAFQWREQTAQRNEITTMNGILYQKNIAIRDATNSLTVLNHQIETLDTSLVEVKANAATNEQLVASQKAEILLLQASNLDLTNDITQYKQAVDTLEAKLKDAYADLQKQNDALTNIVAQRDDLVKKYNDEVKDRNDVVAKYNDLAKQVEKSQGGSKSP
jgi:chromosome segregation ATPase